ncbi:MAG: hypothetical protein L0312_30370, partial [Acidobacteria bacterium]|nr:hypothetical protein [Acidobacteriota bacterium]
MRRSWIQVIATTLVLALGFSIPEGGVLGQENQDRETRIQQKRERLQVLVQRRQQEGANLQPVGELMRGLEPLIQQQKLAEAEALLDRALELANKLGSQEQSGPPPSLQRKMQRLQALAQKRMQAGGDLQPVGELVGGIQPLMQQRKFSEAEAMVDRALKLFGETSAPDNRSLIAYGARDADGRQQIFVVRPDGTGKRRLTQDGNQNFFPAWSPDGKRLAFTSNRSGSPQIWVTDADGANARQLTSQGENVVPTWSPDGKRLAFESNRAGHFQIWVMDADGGNQKQLTTTVSSLGDHAPAWSPDGRRIAFASPKSGNFAIWLMDPDGSHLTQLTTPRGERYRDSNVPAWSPDGTKIAFWSGIE